MNDFLNGWSQGITGNTSGNPSQSVLEAMGRDAARNQWNSNPQQQGGGGTGYGIAKDGVPITKVLFQAGQKMRFKKLARDFGISFALIVTGSLLFRLTPRSLDWVAELVSIPGYIFMFWTFLRMPLYIIGKLGSLSEKPEKPLDKTKA